MWNLRVDWCLKGSSDVPYKLFMNLDQNGNILDMPPHCFLSPTSSPSVSPPASASAEPSIIATTTTAPPTTSKNPQASTTVTPVTPNQFNTGAKVKPSMTLITKEMHQDGVVIPIVAGSNKLSYGSVTIPPQLIPAGWTVTITAVNQTDLAKPKPQSSPSSQCGSDPKNAEESEGDMVTIAFDMIIRDQRGKERTLQELLKRKRHLGEGIQIKLSYSMTSEQKKLFDSDKRTMQFIYLEDGNDAWREVDSETKFSGGKFGSVTTTVDHLTSKFVWSRIVKMSSSSKVTFNSVTYQVLLHCWHWEALVVATTAARPMCGG